MPEHVTLGPPAAPADPPAPNPPAWLRQKLLDPNEQVIWWQGPTEGRWQEWFKNQEGWLVPLTILGFFVFPLIGLFRGPGGFVVGSLLAIGLIAAVQFVVGPADKHKWLVLTNRRLFTVLGRKKTDEFDLALLRQLLASAAPPAMPSNDQVFDLGKLGLPEGAAQGKSEGVTDLASVLAMAKLVQQMGGVRRAE
jgi:hypothetical protein